MKKKQALKIVAFYLDKYIQEKLAFHAGLYKAGLRESWMVKAHKEKKSIERALAVLGQTEFGG